MARPSVCLAFEFLKGGAECGVCQTSNEETGIHQGQGLAAGCSGVRTGQVGGISGELGGRGRQVGRTSAGRGIRLCASLRGALTRRSAQPGGPERPRSPGSCFCSVSAATEARPLGVRGPLAPRRPARAPPGSAPCGARGRGLSPPRAAPRALAGQDNHPTSLRSETLFRGP